MIYDHILGSNVNMSYWALQKILKDINKIVGIRLSKTTKFPQVLRMLIEKNYYFDEVIEYLSKKDCIKCSLHELKKDSVFEIIYEFSNIPLIKRNNRYINPLEEHINPAEFLRKDSSISSDDLYYVLNLYNKYNIENAKKK